MSKHLTDRKIKKLDNTFNINGYSVQFIDYTNRLSKERFFKHRNNAIAFVISKYNAYVNYETEEDISNSIIRYFNTKPYEEEFKHNGVTIIIKKIKNKHVTI